MIALGHSDVNRTSDTPAAYAAGRAGGGCIHLDKPESRDPACRRGGARFSADSPDYQERETISLPLFNAVVIARQPRRLLMRMAADPRRHPFPSNRTSTAGAAFDWPHGASPTRQ